MVVEGDRGALYIATGQPYLDDARQAVQSLKRHNDLSAALISTSELISKHQWVYDEFDHVDAAIRVEDDIVDKAFNIRTWWDKTLYLDPDTYILGDITDVFELADSYDVAAAHAPVREFNPVDVPASFPEFNTGVMLFTDTPTVQHVIGRWRHFYSSQRASDIEVPLHDQAPFRQAIYHSGVPYATLPTEYNCRFIGPGYVQGEVKILHGRHPDREAVGEVLNRQSGKGRVYLGTGVETYWMTDDDDPIAVKGGPP